MNVSSQYQSLDERLNRVLPRITSDDLLQNRGLGNEIGFHVFDYPAEHEDIVREYIRTIVEPALKKSLRPIRFQTVNLFELVIQQLKDRNLLDRAIDMQAQKGDEAVKKALTPVLKEDKLAQYLTTTVPVDELDLILLTGVGSAYPLVRLHSLLNGLHALMKHTPLVVFYPGKYDGVSLRLFGLHTEQNDANAPYYRAFQLLK